MKVKTGQKVICVNNTPNRSTCCKVTVPVKGKIYTIRDVYTYTLSDSKNIVAFTFVEIVNEFLDEVGREVGYHSNRFKAVDSLWVNEILEKAKECVEEAV